jgi:hypothetical protein
MAEIAILLAFLAKTGHLEVVQIGSFSVSGLTVGTG